ncbi:MAG: MobC family replication-relaxation protein [Pseudomonadota bacterium]
MKYSGNLISSPITRELRRDEKCKLVLRFLRQHIWSTQDILQIVLSLQSRQATHKNLIGLEHKGLLRRHTYAALGGNITIWGITMQGQAQAFDIEFESMLPSYFEPSRVSEQTVRHELDIQKLRLKAEALGWHSWVDGNRLGSKLKSQSRPDALCINLSGHLVAIECERTFKSLKRYEQILISYLKLIKSGEINSVVWVCPTKEMTQRLKMIITSIKHVQVLGQKIQIEPLKHHANLYFCSYDDWPIFIC